MDEITSKWITTGLLDGITSEEDKITLAHLLNRATQEIRAREFERKDNGVIYELFLPIIVRLFMCHKINDIRDMPSFYDYFTRFYDANRELISDLNSYIVRDGEEQFCWLFVEKYGV
jgi:hypothetical protein